MAWFFLLAPVDVHAQDVDPLPPDLINHGLIELGGGALLTNTGFGAMLSGSWRVEVQPTVSLGARVTGHASGLGVRAAGTTSAWGAGVSAEAVLGIATVAQDAFVFELGAGVGWDAWRFYECGSLNVCREQRGDGLGPTAGAFFGYRRRPRDGEVYWGAGLRAHVQLPMFPVRSDERLDTPHLYFSLMEFHLGFQRSRGS